MFECRPALDEVVFEELKFAALGEHRCFLMKRSILEVKNQIARDTVALRDLRQVTNSDGIAFRGPEFEKAMNGLRDGEVSQPIQTPFGWHLVQVVERRADDASEDRRKMNARQSVKVRKSDEAFQDWLRQARDKAYVENRYDER